MARSTKAKIKEENAKAKKAKAAVEEEIEEEEVDLDDEDLDVDDIDIEDDIEDDEDFDSDEDEGEEEEEEAPKKGAAKNKDTKKAGKKVEGPKKEKKSKKGETPKHMQVPANMITVKDLEEEFGTTGKAIRTILRDNDFEKPEGMGRWAWKKSDPQLKELRKLLSGSGKKAKKGAAPEKEEAAPKGKSRKGNK